MLFALQVYDRITISIDESINTVLFLKLKHVN